LAPRRPIEFHTIRKPPGWVDPTLTKSIEDAEAAEEIYFSASKKFAQYRQLRGAKQHFNKTNTLAIASFNG